MSGSYTAPLNLYRAPAPLPLASHHATTAAADYDQNFLWTVPAYLATDSCRLVPFVPSLHAEACYKAMHTDAVIDSGLFDYMPTGHYLSLTHFLTWIESKRIDPFGLFFVIFDTSLKFVTKETGEEVEVADEDDKRIAGIISFLRSDPVNYQTEIGNVHILPQFHKTHIQSHASSLLLSYCFSPILSRTTTSTTTTASPLAPPPATPGLALRRMTWGLNALNAPSHAAALRLGFTYETTHLWDRVLPVTKPGRELPEWAKEREAGLGRGGRGRDTVLLAMGFDEWESVGRERVERLVQRKVVGKVVVIG